MTNYNERLDKILMAYKRYPYGTSAAPHISGDEAKQALRTLFQEALDEVLGKNVVYSKAVNNHLALQRQRAMVKLNEMFGEEK